MSERTFYGTRVGVLSADMSADLGLGTHLGEEMIAELGNHTSPKILLDTGKVIYGYQCNWTELEGAPPLKPFRITLGTRARLLENEGRLLINTRRFLSPGMEVLIEGLVVAYFDHRSVVAAMITLDGDTFFLLTEEIRFPQFEG